MAPPPRNEPAHRTSGFRQPVVWLGIAVFVASIAGSVWLIVVSVRYDDAAVPAAQRIFGVPKQPAAATPAPDAASGSQRPARP